VAVVVADPVPSAAAPTSATRGFQFALLTVAAAAAAYAATAVNPLQEAMRASQALSDNQIAILQGPALASALVTAAVPLGLLVDRYSRARLLLAFALLDLVGTLFTALAPNFFTLILARCLIGLTATATTVTAFSLLADLYAPAHRGRASMVVVIGQFAGTAAAFALGGVLLTASGSAPDSWRWALVWLAAPLLLVALSMLAMREPARSGLEIKNPSARETFRELWRFRTVIAPLLAGLVMAEVAFRAVLVWAAPTFSRSFSLAPDRVGALMSSVVLVSGVLGSVAGGTLADYGERIGGPRRTMSILSILTLLSAPAAVFAVMPGVVSAGALFFVFMTVVGAILVVAVALLTVVVPNELRGLCMAVSAAANVLLGIGLAPVTVSLLSGLLGGPARIGTALSLTCVVTCLFGAGLFTCGVRHFPRRSPALPTKA